MQQAGCSREADYQQFKTETDGLGTVRCQDHTDEDDSGHTSAVKVYAIAAIDRAPDISPWWYICGHGNGSGLWSDQFASADAARVDLEARGAHIQSVLETDFDPSVTE